MKLIKSLLIIQSIFGSSAFSGSGSDYGFSRQSSQLEHSRRRRRTNARDGGTAVNMMDPDLSSVLLSVAGPLVLEAIGRESALPPAISTMRLLPTETLSTAARAITNTDPEVKAEVCANFAHVGLDLVAFASPAKVLLRLSVMIGRVFAIMSDYLPDQAMNPEEVVFQLLMLSISTTLFAKSVRPALAAASMDSVSFRDRRAYQVIFRKFGLTWLQFKMLTATAAEWIEVPPNGAIPSHQDDNDSEYIYLLHEGDAEVRMNGKMIQRVSRNVDRHGICFLGDMEFAQKLQKDANIKNHASPPKVGARSAEGKQISHKTDLLVGPSGATLLRLDMSKLQDLMSDDEQIASSMRSIVFAGMQERLGALLENAGQHQTNVTETQGKMAAAVA